MQGLYGGFSMNKRIHIDRAKAAYSQLYVGCEWNEDKCQLGCYDLECRGSAIFETERFVIAFFGEAYGIVDDDTNLMEDYPVRTGSELGKLLTDKGGKAIESLNGAFVAAIYAKKNSELRIYNDRFGIYPVFYTITNDGGFYFSQDPMLLRQVENFEPDYIGISEYLSFDYCLEDRTFFKNVNYILPAQRIIVNKNGINRDTYWELPRCDGKKDKSKKDYLREFNDLYREAVFCRKGTKANVIGLSGGFDSRLILAILDGENVSSFNFGSPNSGDVVGASALAKAYNTDHHYLDFDGLDYTDIARETVIRTGGQCHHEEFYQLAAAKEKYKITQSVELAGIGGDAISGQKSNFTGLIPFMSAKMTRRRKAKHKKRLLKDITRGRQPAYDKKYYGPIITNSWEELKKDYNRAINEAEKGITFGNYTMRLKMRSIERRITMPSMAITDQFIPVRLPVYDYRVVNFFNSLPQTYRYGQRLYIRLIQDYYPKAAACPHSETGRPVRESHCVTTDFVTVLNFIRGKLGGHKTKYTNIFQFADDAMLKNPSLQNIVSSGGISETGIFNLDNYGTVDNIINSARNGDNAAVKLLKNIIQFSIINDVYFDGKVSMYYKSRN